MTDFQLVNSKPMNDLILAHLQKVGDISSMEAQAQYRCRSLSRRITDLKRKGHNIVSMKRKDQTGQRYVRYHYLGTK